MITTDNLKANGRSNFIRHQIDWMVFMNLLLMFISMQVMGAEPFESKYIIKSRYWAYIAFLLGCVGFLVARWESLSPKANDHAFGANLFLYFLGGSAIFVAGLYIC
ncbi:hypothetical protein FRC03_004819 [Tulasnella sp. 419]|nr:hypothetical protein FRC03_004819 [Tulasnella sp. 419]